MNTVISSLSEFVDLLESNASDGWVFRGQADASWDLVPSIYRGLEGRDVGGWEDYIGNGERDIFRTFADRARRFGSGGTPWDTLVQAQHYGTPTRLLDWTTNAYHALYFAACAQSQVDGAIWCAVPAAVPMPPGFGRIHDGHGYRKERLTEFIPERELAFCMPTSQTSPPPGTPIPPPVPAFDQAGLQLSGFLTFFLPPHTNDRIAAQSGLFSVFLSREPTEIVIDHAEYLRAVENYTGATILYKIVVPAAAKGVLLHSLSSRAGVDAAAVYPDLQGLGMHLMSVQQRLVESIT